MKSICPILVITLMTTVVFAQDKNQQPDTLAQPQASIAGTISHYVLQGKVTDLVTGRGIGTATVEAVDSHKKLHTTLTNPDGTYRLEHLPREQALNVRCSQLGYSPNPKGDIAKFKGGTATWNPRLVQENGDVAYLHTTAKYLAALPPREREINATYISVNLPPASRSVVAAELKMKLGSPGGANSSNDTVALFTPSPASDEQIRQAILTALKSDLQDKHEVKVIRPIKIDVVDGHVKLAGAVDSQADKDLVYQTATEVPSPVDVENDVTVLNKPREQ
jgi:hypothetical protein